MLIPIITPIVLLLLFWGGIGHTFFSEKSVMSGADFSRKRRDSVTEKGGKKQRFMRMLSWLCTMVAS